MPADVDAPTGGNVYDLALTDAMRADGDHVELMRCDSDDVAGALARGWDGPTLVDGLLASTVPDALAGSGSGVLLHMPLALDPALSPAQARRLDAQERRMLHAASRVVATSFWSARFVAEHHGVDDVAVAPPGAELARLSRGSTPPLFVHVAAMLPNKDQLGVVAALSRLRDLSWQARLVGSTDRDPAYAAAVAGVVHEEGLADRVTVTGNLSREAAWAGADLALLPSYVEAYGMVVTEALARGVPAVVSESGAVEALGTTADGERPGVVVPAGDPAALADALRHWLFDPEHRQRLRRAALARRSTLEGWDVTARRVRAALTRR